MPNAGKLPAGLSVTRITVSLQTEMERCSKAGLGLSGFLRVSTVIEAPDSTKHADKTFQFARLNAIFLDAIIDGLVSMEEPARNTIAMKMPPNRSSWIMRWRKRAHQYVAFGPYRRFADDRNYFSSLCKVIAQS